MLKSDVIRREFLKITAGTGAALAMPTSGHCAGLLQNDRILVGGKVTSQDLPPDDSRVEPYFTGFLSSLNTHVAEKNWKSIYFQHILDEPHGNEPPYYARIADLVHRNLPGVLTMDAVDASNIPEELKKNCDVWVPQFGRFDNQMELIRDRIQSGHDVWFYTCLFPNNAA
jgi:hypothetical protein